MSPEEILTHVRRQPFQPFRVFISDGSCYEARHPEMIVMTRTNVIIAIPGSDADVPEKSTFCDPVHVTRIEPINGQENPES